jgi:hypothetical protein
MGQVILNKASGDRLQAAGKKMIDKILHAACCPLPVASYIQNKK